MVNTRRTTDESRQAAIADRPRRKTKRQLKKELTETEIKFRKACDQIIILNKKMESVQKRYNRAKETNFRIFRYKLRLRLAIIEGVRNVYYEYANRKANDIVNIRRELYGEIVEIVTTGADDESDSN
ncbi:hypothetical protein CHS0354_031164 [Potamilus streckersoni]|uniref:Uncharacterized protein n=1 Tax=Potamilus streckersoni TaxID=2493646 RepID=A0AAE0TKJ2_9BIVA|nr:hypothetical protein CHS0354_031164 [Potamilus streckersoni]